MSPDTHIPLQASLHTPLIAAYAITQMCIHTSAYTHTHTNTHSLRTHTLFLQTKHTSSHTRGRVRTHTSKTRQTGTYKGAECSILVRPSSSQRTMTMDG